jgi:hypothetical protein
MHKFLVLISLVVYCEAAGLGGGYLGVASYGVIPAAIKSVRKVEVIPVALPQDPIVPQVIQVDPIDLPIKILFNSRSSGIFVEQVHQPGAPGQVEKTSSEEEPHRVVHEVRRPVIQELREVIVPYRRVVQEIQPVVEQVQTIVARGEPRVEAVVAPVAVAAPVAPVAAIAPAQVAAVGLGGGLAGSALIGDALIGDAGLAGFRGLGAGLGLGGKYGGRLATIGTKGGLLLGGYKAAKSS